MPERQRPAAKPKLTRRRDDDPVKIFKDFRVAWWPSGVPGAGERKMERTGSAENARAFAEEKYAEIDRHRSRGPRSHVPLGVVWLRYVKFLRDTKTPRAPLTSTARTGTATCPKRSPRSAAATSTSATGRRSSRRC